MRWFGHVQRSDSTFIGRMLKMELLGRKQRGRPTRRLMNLMREDRSIVGLRE